MWRSGPAALIGRLFYVGALPQIYTMPQFEVQARWALMVIMGSISVPSADEIRRDCDAWADAYVDKYLRARFSNSVQTFSRVFVQAG